MLCERLLLYLNIPCFRVVTILLLLLLAWRLLFLHRCLLVMPDNTMPDRYLYLVGDSSVRMYPPLKMGLGRGWHCQNLWTDRNLALPLPTSTGTTSKLCSGCCCCWLGRRNKLLLLFPVWWLLSSWPRRSSKLLVIIFPGWRICSWSRLSCKVLIVLLSRW